MLMQVGRVCRGLLSFFFRLRSKKISPLRASEVEKYRRFFEVPDGDIKFGETFKSNIAAFN